MDKHGTERVHLRVHVEVHLCDEHRCGNGELNGPRAKAMSHVIMGMTDAQVNDNQHPLLGSGESTTVTRVPKWGGDVDGRVHGVWTNALGKRAIFV